MFGDEDIEAGDESAVAVGLVDPSTLLCVRGSRFGVDALRGEDGDARRVGAEARAVLADVRVGARSLGWDSQAVTPGQAGLVGRLLSPVADRLSPDRDACRPAP